MRLGITNLKRLAGVGLCAAAVLFGGASVARAQEGRHEMRKIEHRTLKEHQKFERRALQDQIRTEHRLYGNTSAWRTRRQTARLTLRQHQRAERLAFRQRYNPGRHLGRGYYRAPGQRVRYVRRTSVITTPRYYRGRRLVVLRPRLRR